MTLDEILNTAVSAISDNASALGLSSVEIGRPDFTPSVVPFALVFLEPLELNLLEDALPLRRTRLLTFVGTTFATITQSITICEDIFTIYKSIFTDSITKARLTIDSYYGDLVVSLLELEIIYEPQTQSQTA
ncbi:MAG TPA: hypothetical protein PLU67_02580 [Candidatus Kapabacteria bacterium]|nr:hypothetical protein [Candidatus Kapabacteria bacterium]HOM04360.1 hypothetical protein [Candidatus Kapabacteria bacterium]HPP38667.1 hypothetical protein [Candidatus Kapabacteria bacterium]